MQTTVTIIRSDGTEDQRELDWPLDPGYDAINDLLQPILGDGRSFERVSVLHQSQTTDMFVDDRSINDALPRNEKATAIYRNYALTQRPGTDPENLPHIAGTAVLMSRRVWF